MYNKKCVFFKKGLPVVCKGPKAVSCDGYGGDRHFGVVYKQVFSGTSYFPQKSVSFVFYLVNMKVFILVVIILMTVGRKFAEWESEEEGAAGIASHEAERWNTWRNR